jgi:hypothetical protein
MTQYLGETRQCVAFLNTTVPKFLNILVKLDFLELYRQWGLFPFIYDLFCHPPFARSRVERAGGIWLLHGFRSSGGITQTASFTCNANQVLSSLGMQHANLLECFPTSMSHGRRQDDQRKLMKFFVYLTV